MRALLALLLLVSGCQSTGAKILGPLAVASAIGSGYMIESAGPPASIERGRIVHHDDHRFEYGAALGVASIAALGAWFILETSHRERRWSGGGYGGGGGLSVASGAPVTVEVPAPPAVEARPRPRFPGRRSPYDRGWHLDPADGQHKLYDRAGFYVGRFDAEGNVWTDAEEPVGRVDTSPGCAIACRRSQARKALLGDDLVD